jgi:hypothetical protein
VGVAGCGGAFHRRAAETLHERLELVHGARAIPGAREQELAQAL